MESRYIVKVAVSSDYLVSQRVKEKRDKYPSQTRNISLLYPIFRTEIVPIVVS